MKYNLWSEVRLAFNLEVADRPLMVLIFAHIFPEISRMFLFAYFAYMARGIEGVVFAIPGIAVIAFYRALLSEPSDIPVRDSAYGIFNCALNGGVRLFFRYILRSVPLLFLAIFDSLVSVFLLSLFVEELSMGLGIFKAFPLLIPALFGTLFCGLTISAFAIGNAYQNLIHNAAASLFVVGSGALFDTKNFPFLNLINNFFPGTHSIKILRALLNENSALSYLASELCVTTFWFVMGMSIYSVMVRHARLTGKGIFAI